MPSSIYYQMLARDMMARAKEATNQVEASRLKRSAEEYRILAKAFLEEPTGLAQSSAEPRGQSRRGS